MAYNNYYSPYQNQYYSQLQAQQPVQMPVVQPQQNTNNGLIWVQGEAGAKSYLVAPNNTVMLMDSETQRFYLKSSDASGMPLPLRVFEYSELASKAPVSPSGKHPTDSTPYATKAELEAFKDEINGILKNVTKEAEPDG